MILTARTIADELKKDYKNPKCKLEKLVKQGKYTPIIRGFYETNPKTAGYLLSGFYSPSYLSFEYALYRYSIIPEAVFVYTLATYGKNRSKEYDTPFGTYSFQDVPKEVYPYGLRVLEENGYIYWMATPEKALCDQLYSIKPIEHKRYFENLLFDDMRVYEDSLDDMDIGLISKIAPKYHSTNVNLFCKLMEER